MKSTPSILEYLIVYVALMVLLILTLGSALLNLGPFNPIISISIACTKALLVGLFFMHLKGSKSLTQVFAMAGIFWLGVLFTLALTDYFSRGWLLMPGRWPMCNYFNEVLIQCSNQEKRSRTKKYHHAIKRFPYRRHFESTSPSFNFSSK
jgi:cytochrome c oxidase subunit 4